MAVAQSLPALCPSSIFASFNRIHPLSLSLSCHQSFMISERETRASTTFALLIAGREASGSDGLNNKKTGSISLSVTDSVGGRLTFARLPSLRCDVNDVRGSVSMQGRTPSVLVVGQYATFEHQRNR